MTYSPRNPNGATTAASSSPVAIATDQLQDALITGQSGQSASGNNIMLAVAGTGSIDTMAPGSGQSYRSFCCQIIASSGISAGQIIFEGSNDDTNWMTVIVADDVNLATSARAAAQTISASTIRFFSGKINTRYVRCRISTGFSGGTVQALTRFSCVDTLPRGRVFNEVYPGFGSSYSAVTTAGTNAAAVSTTTRNLLEIAVSNVAGTDVFVKLYDKASSPTVGTDVPVLTIPVSANSVSTREFGPYGKRFGTGIAIAATGAIAATDSTNAVAGVQIHATYV